MSENNHRLHISVLYKINKYKIISITLLDDPVLDAASILSRLCVCVCVLYTIYLCYINRYQIII